MADAAYPVDPEEVKRRVSLESVIGAIVALHRQGRESVGLCPFHDEKSGSFTVNPDKGFYHCFGCGAHGDVIGFYMQHHQVGFREALLALAQLAGMAVPEAARLQARPKQDLKRIAPAPTPRPVAASDAELADRDRKLAHIKAIWRQCLPADGTAVEAYLRGRGIDLDALGGVPRSLRFHPEMRHIHPKSGAVSFWPAMVGAAQALNGDIVGIHRTYLSFPDAAGHVGKAPADRVPKAKLVLGQCMQAAVRLAPVATHLGVSEGIENGLIVMAELRRDGEDLAVWAAMTLGNIGGGGAPGRRSRPHPLDPARRLQTEFPDPARPGILLPPLVKRVTVLGDGDSDPYTTRAIVNRGVRRWQAEGREVQAVWAPPGHDFCDMGDIARGGDS